MDRACLTIFFAVERLNHLLFVLEQYKVGNHDYQFNEVNLGSCNLKAAYLKGEEPLSLVSFSGKFK